MRFLAHGGMGEVYEAYDEDLQQRVALKTLRSHLGGHPQMLDQFRREVQHALAVTHPNVCRVHDLGRHEGGFFLTMQYLQGETLAARLERGPLPLDEASALAEQLAAALDAAHQTGIVHRDFKSANVMLTRSGGTRALVTDFGLAQPVRGVAASLVGSFPYMAPEQVEGGAITAAADIYALGVVLFEMVTGHRPFAGANPLETARLRLTQAPPSPRALRPDLPLRWERAILRCLARDPSARFASAGAAAAALREKPRGASFRPAAAVVLAGLVAVGGSLAPARAGWPAMAATPLAPPSHRPSVAVLGLDGLDTRPDDAWLGAGLSEMLASELAAGEDLRVVSSAAVSRVRLEIGALGPSGAGYGGAVLSRLRTTLDTDAIVAGTWRASGDAIRLDLIVQDAASGTVQARRSETGRRDDLSGLVQRAGLGVRQALALGASRPQGPPLGTQHAEALRWYSEGLTRLRDFDAIQGRLLLEKAVAADPEFALARIALAEAWSTLGYDGRAREEAAQAAASAESLTREQKLFVQATAANVRLDRPEAARLFASLFAFFPDNLDYGLQLAAAQARAGSPDAAWATVQQLRRAGLGGDDPRLDLQEATVAAFRADLAGEMAASQRALSRAIARGEDTLIARASRDRAWTLARAGERQAAIDAGRTALRIGRRLGDRSGAASALALIAFVQMALDSPDADRALAEALALHRAVGNRRAVASDQSMFSVRYVQQGRYAEALAARQEAMTTFAEMGVASALARHGMEQGANLLALGRMAEAEQACREALSALRQLRQPNQKPDCVLVAAAAGELGQARDLSEQLGQSAAGAPERRADAQQSAADLAWLAADFAAARRQIEPARAFFAAQPNTWSLAMANHTLAAVALAEGQLAEALARAAEAEDGFRTYPSPYHTWMHTPVRPLVLLAQGKVDEAAALIDDPAWPLGHTEHAPANLAVDIARGRIWAAQGRTAEAKARLQAALAKAAELGIPLLELDARTGLAEAGLSTSAAGEARRELERLEIEAQARGFAVLARRITALLGAGTKA